MSSSKSDSKYRKRDRSSSSSSEDEISKDRKDRDDFVKRLKDKERNKTRNIVLKNDKKSIEEAAKRLKLEASGDRDEWTKYKRIESRRQYLGKHKDDKIYLLEAELKDEQRLFKDVKLTEKERREYEFKQNILRLAKEHDKASEIELKRKYYIPSEDAKPDDYVEVDEREKQFNSEQR